MNQTENKIYKQAAACRVQVKRAFEMIDIKIGVVKNQRMDERDAARDKAGKERGRAKPMLHGNVLPQFLIIQYAW